MTRLIVTEKRFILFVYRLVLDAKPDRGMARKRYFASSAKGLSRFFSSRLTRGKGFSRWAIYFLVAKNFLADSNTIYITLFLP